MARTIANCVAERRRIRGLSQGDLARAAGVTRQAVSAIEGGRVQPGVQIALAFARALGASVEELFGNQTRLDAELFAPGEWSSARAAVALVDGRVVARPIDGRQALPEAAGALIAAAAQGRAQLEPLARTEELESTVFVSGCEPALGLLAAHVNAAAGRAVWFASSNRDALAELRAHRVHAAALHGSSEEVLRLVRRAGDDAFDVYELATIEEGWVLARNNPKKVRGARDLNRAGMRLANRGPGSAARTLLDAELRRAGIAAQSVAGYTQTLGGHADVARAVAFGYADAGIAVAGVAEAFRLEFIPLRSERCVLAIRRGDRGHAGVITLLSALRSNAFKRDLSSFGPYDTTHLGELH